MRPRNPNSPNLEEIIKDQPKQPSTLKQSPPTPSISEVVESKKSKPITTNPIGNSMEYYWDNTFMVFIEPEVRRQRTVPSEPQSVETINTIESTNPTSQF